MQIDPEEFRRRFEDLSDEALLEVKRDELVDVAQQLYDAELERRGLLEEEEELAEEESGDGAPDNPQDQMVLAAECGSMQEVQFARALLKSAGIPTYVQTDFSGILGATEEDTRVYVPASYLEQAKEILATPLSDEELEAQAEAAGFEDEEEEPEDETPQSESPHE
jgi:hypothetical protein